MSSWFSIVVGGVGGKIVILKEYFRVGATAAQGVDSLGTLAFGAGTEGVTGDQFSQFGIGRGRHSTLTGTVFRVKIASETAGVIQWQNACLPSRSSRVRVPSPAPSLF
jgi:hypothetical protein